MDTASAAAPVAVAVSEELDGAEDDELGGALLVGAELVADGVGVGVLDVVGRTERDVGAVTCRWVEARDEETRRLG